MVFNTKRMYSKVKLSLQFTSILAALAAFISIPAMLIYYYFTPLNLVLSECELLLIEQNYTKRLDSWEKNNAFTSDLRNKITYSLPYWWSAEHIIFIRDDGKVWGELNPNNSFSQKILQVSAERMQYIIDRCTSDEISFHYDYFLGIPYKVIAAKKIDYNQDQINIVLISYLTGIDSLLTILTAAIITCLLILLFTSFASKKITTPLIDGCHKLIAIIRSLPDTAYGIPIPTSFLQKEVADIAKEMECMRQKIVTQIHQLESYAQEQAEFASNVAHELQTPITGTSNWIQLLAEVDNISAEQKKICVERIMLNVATLSNVVDNLLVISRLDATTPTKKDSLEDEEILLLQALQTLVAPLLQKWSDKHHTISWDIREDCRMHTSKAVFDIIFGNILDNAFKYSPEKAEIRLSSHCENEKLLLRISNEGSLLKKEDLALMQKKYYRADANSSNVRGWGIGLYLVQKAVKILDAELVVNARPRGGLDVDIIFNKDSFYKT